MIIIIIINNNIVTNRTSRSRGQHCWLLFGKSSLQMSIRSPAIPDQVFFDFLSSRQLLKTKLSASIHFLSKSLFSNLPTIQHCIASATDSFFKQIVRNEWINIITDKDRALLKLPEGPGIAFDTETAASEFGFQAFFPKVLATSSDISCCYIHNFHSPFFPNIFIVFTTTSHSVPSDSPEETHFLSTAFYLFVLSSASN